LSLTTFLEASQSLPYEELAAYYPFFLVRLGIEHAFLPSLSSRHTRVSSRKWDVELPSLFSLRSLTPKEYRFAVLALPLFSDT